MEDFSKIWRAFFAIGIIGIAVQQIIFADFRPVIIPSDYPAWLMHRLLWAWVISVALCGSSIAILFEFKGRTVSLLMGALLLLMVLAFQISGTPYPGHIGSWTNAFKELTLSGGFFVVAGSFMPENTAPDFIKLLAKFIPFGKYFFAFTLGLFGSMHFAYPEFCAALVPRWMHFYYFWMYFGAVALIAGGLGIMIKPTRRIAALLSGIMLFLWFLMLHIPRAIADPHSGNGNEWSSVFEALAFSGIAFIIAGNNKKVISDKFSPHRL